MLFCFLSHRRERWQRQSHHCVSRVPHIWGHNRQGISQRADLPDKCTQVKPHTDVVLHTETGLLRVIHWLISDMEWDEVRVAFSQESFSFCRDAYSSVPVGGSAEFLCCRCCWLMTRSVYQYFTQNPCTQWWTRGGEGEVHKPSFISSPLKFSLVQFSLLFQMSQRSSLLIFFILPTYFCCPWWVNVKKPNVRRA